MNEPLRTYIGSLGNAVNVVVPREAIEQAHARLDAERAAIRPQLVVDKAFMTEIVGQLAGYIAADRARAVRRGDIQAVHVADTRAWRLREGVAASQRKRAPP